MRFLRHFRATGHLEYSAEHRRCSVNASDGQAESMRASFTRGTLTEVNAEVTNSAPHRTQQGGGVWGDVPRGAATT